MPLGISSAVSQVSETIGEVVSTLNKGTPDATKIAELEQQIQIAQTEVNKLEAQSGSMFVSGWRPFIGWVCAIALLYNSILEPLLGFIAVTTGIIPVHNLPDFKDELLYPVLLGMLGLGGMRSYEKKHNMARENMRYAHIERGSSLNSSRLRNSLSKGS